jgi:RNA polymerase-binding transcription factor DksA
MEENLKVRFSDAELLEFSELIKKKLEHAKTEFEFISNQISDLNGNGSDREGGDFMDDSNKQSELELLNNMVFRQKQFIRNLENALIRIRNKTYGICTVTGQLIDKKRLELVPHATKSVAGKNKEQIKDRSSLDKKNVSKRFKPKTITKIVRKLASDLKNTDPVLGNWEIDEDDKFDEIDIIEIDFNDGNEDHND